MIQGIPPPPLLMVRPLKKIFSFCVSSLIAYPQFTKQLMYNELSHNLYQSRHSAYITNSVKTWFLKNLSVYVAWNCLHDSKFTGLMLIFSFSISHCAKSKQPIYQKPYRYIYSQPYLLLIIIIR